MLIGVVGFAGSGKGTVGDLLVSRYGYKKMAFADPLKDATAAIFGWDRTLLEGDTKESREFRETIDPFWSSRFGFDVTPRWALQKLGTEGGREVFHNDLWISALERRIDSDNVVVTDVRFPNEISKIKSLGGRVVRVMRGDEPEWFETAYKTNTSTNAEKIELICNGGLMMEKYPEIHISEWAWIGQPMDFVLYNNGSLEELEANLADMLRSAV